MKNKSGITPCGHYILILPDKVETKSAGGIIMAPETIENAKRDATQGFLVAVGPIGWAEFNDGKPWAKIGDRVAFGRHAGKDMTGEDGERYILANCEDILAVLDDGN